MSDTTDFDPFEAAFSGDTEGLEQFLFQNPDAINSKSEDGDTLLHMACWGKQIGVLGILLANNPDVNAIGSYGRTPLHYAVHEGRMISVSIVITLINAGANPAIEDANGFTPGDWARVEMGEGGLKEVLEILEKRG